MLLQPCIHTYTPILCVVSQKEAMTQVFSSPVTKQNVYHSCIFQGKLVAFFTHSAPSHSQFKLLHSCSNAAAHTYSKVYFPNGFLGLVRLRRYVQISLLATDYRFTFLVTDSSSSPGFPRSDIAIIGYSRSYVWTMVSI